MKVQASRGAMCKAGRMPNLFAWGQLSVTRMANTLAKLENQLSCIELSAPKRIKPIYIYMQVYIIHVYYCSILIHRTVPVCSGLGWSILVVGVDMFVFLSVKCKGLGFNSANAA